MELYNEVRIIYNYGMEMKTIGERIRAARLSKDITQAELAKLVGKKPNTISNYEAGSRVMPLTDIFVFADVLDRPVTYFFGDIDPDGELSELYNRLNPANKQLAINLLRSLFEQQSKISE